MLCRRNDLATELIADLPVELFGAGSVVEVRVAGNKCAICQRVEV